MNLLCDKCGRPTAFSIGRGARVLIRGVVLCGACCGDPHSPLGLMKGWHF